MPGALLLLVLAFTSCDLDEINPSGSTADAIWGTPEGFETLVNGAYYNVREQFYGRTDIVFFAEMGSDLWINGWNRDWFHQVSKYDGMDATRGQINNFWTRFYNPINMCNAGLGRIDDAGIPTVAHRNTREGELRFLRAYYYWHIVETFGGVDLRTTETKEPVLTVQRSSVHDFYDLIINDLERAEDILPVVNTEYGRATKASAMGLLARMYLSYASYLEYHEKNSAEAKSYFTLAKQKAVEIIESQGELGIKLYDTFEELFKPSNNKNNQEAMFVITHSLNSALRAGSYNHLHQYFNPKYQDQPGMVLDFQHGYADQDRVMPTRYLLELFNEEIDARYYASFREVWYRNDAEATPRNQYNKWQEMHVQRFGKPTAWEGTPFVEIGDTALYVTKKVIADKATRRYPVLDINDIYDEDGSVSEKTEISGYRMWPALIKYQDPDRETPTTRDGFKDVIVMRLAEMYLIAAEAELYLGNTESAANYINVLRERAAVPGRVAEMKVVASDINFQFIMDERARELCGEHLRWFDLKRWKKIEDVVGPGKANPDIIHFDPNKHYLRPIPVQFLDAILNRDEFGQNPGYDVGGDDQ